MEGRAGRAGRVRGASRREVLWMATLAACRQVCPDIARGTLIEVLPMMDASAVDMGPMVDTGLSGRRFTDLTMVGEDGASDAMIIPNEMFYVRTAAPALPAGEWTILLHGLVAQAVQRGLSDLLAEIPAQDLGEVLLECSGNTASSGFGLISATRWGGIPLAEVLALAEPLAEAVALEVVGVDFAEQSKNSIPGCSWIFPLDALADAYLVTTMDGAALPEEHGGPVRLILPGWYGCCQVKWVTELRFVGADEPSSAQMQEFAAPTHQIGIPALARDFLPATMDPAAMAIRVERWEVDGEESFRVVGVLWGGDQEIYDLHMIVDNRDPVPVEILPASPWTWRRWTCCVERLSRGEHAIRLVILDGVQTRRLDSGWYERTVKV